MQSYQSDTNTAAAPSHACKRQTQNPAYVSLQKDTSSMPMYLDTAPGILHYNHKGMLLQKITTMNVKSNLNSKL